jgi:hypothetical protein
MDSATSSSTSRSARRCIVQCSRPSGGALQASATRSASGVLSRFGWAPDQVHEALRTLEASGAARLIERYGARFWCAADACYAPAAPAQ